MHRYSPTSRPKPLHLNSGDSVGAESHFRVDTDTYVAIPQRHRDLRGALGTQSSVFHPWGSMANIPWLGLGTWESHLHASLSHRASWPVLGKSIQAAVL